jgi:hypothetical protein
MPNANRGDNLTTYYSDVRQEILGQIEVGIVVPEGFQDNSFRLNPFTNNTNKFLRDQLLEEKKAPEDLHSLITDRERIGATLFIIEKHAETQSWFVRYKTNKFFLTSMVINMKEKVQIQETFGTSLVSFFGDSVKIYEFTGIAIDWPSAKYNKAYRHWLGDEDPASYKVSYDPETGKTNIVAELWDQTSDVGLKEEQYLENADSPKNFWQSSLIHMYNNVLRGTQLVQNDRVALLSVGTHYVYGYPLTLSVNYTAQTEKLASFSMSWVVLDHTMGYDGIEEDDFEDNYKFAYEYAPMSQEVTGDIRIPESLRTLPKLITSV